MKTDNSEILNKLIPGFDDYLVNLSENTKSAKAVKAMFEPEEDSGVIVPFNKCHNM